MYFQPTRDATTIIIWSLASRRVRRWPGIETTWGYLLSSLNGRSQPFIREIDRLSFWRKATKYRLWIRPGGLLLPSAGRHRPVACPTMGRRRRRRPIVGQAMGHRIRAHSMDSQIQPLDPERSRKGNPVSPDSQAATDPVVIQNSTFWTREISSHKLALFTSRCSPFRRTLHALGRHFCVILTDPIVIYFAPLNIIAERNSSSLLIFRRDCTNLELPNKGYYQKMIHFVKSSKSIIIKNHTSAWKNILWWSWL